MKIEKSIDSVAVVENAGGLYYLSFPYKSTVGIHTDDLSVRVPIKSANPSDKDKQALAEALSVQGALGTWIVKSDGSVWLTPAKEV